ncbi:MAG: hypothetical protein HDT15_11555 [Oscillibacter sp.]|nr:hypothetical protein [Oscillibacter sp.]
MYSSNTTQLKYASIGVKVFLLSAFTFLFGALCSGLAYVTAGRVRVLVLAARYILAASLAFAVITVIVHLIMPDTYRICEMVRRGLYCPAYGNPLHLRDGVLLPLVRCKKAGLGLYDLTITARSVTVETIVNASSAISSMLNRKFERYAITQTNTDVAYNYVTFRLEDVTIDRSLTYHSVKEMRPGDPTVLSVQNGTSIDLTTSGSMLVAGVTRSGKTTGIIALLLQVLLAGRDNYQSEVIIIDPKRAELSQLPYVVTLDDNGEATQILAAMEHFADTIVQRQRVLNRLSVERGDAVHWWEAGFHPSFIFIDEYVSCRTMFPKKGTKNSPSYSIEQFDSFVKRIVTMGASAGCYMIISIAEASVDEGGLPSMIRSAMSTRVLFQPTLAEGRLIWGGSNEKLKNFAVDRVYGKGDAWFSSTDGVHDVVSFVHFPYMKFPVYGELGRLLQAYYKDNRVNNTPPPSEAEAAVPKAKQL